MSPEPPARVLVAQLVVTLLVIGWAGFGFVGVSITDARGTEEFYASVSQVLAALLIAFALGLRGLAAAWILVFGRPILRAPLPLFVAALLLMLMLGEGRTLEALLDCSQGFCADSDTLNDVIFALIGGAVLVAVSLVLAAVSVLDADGVAGDSGRPDGFR